MIDLSQTIIPRSDQLNADDLIAGPMTVKVTKVSANPSAPDQPISIYFDGDNGKPYKPCKSMRRVLVHAWGSNGLEYVGRSMTLRLDPSVKFGGIEVGGIRISHMSDLQRSMSMALTATRGSRKTYTVDVLKVQASPYEQALEAAKLGTEKLGAWWKAQPGTTQQALKSRLDELKKIAAAVPGSTGSGEAAGSQSPPVDEPAATEWGVPEWYQAGSDAKIAGDPRKLPDGIPNDLAMQDAFLAGYDETVPDGAAAQAATA